MTPGIRKDGALRKNELRKNFLLYQSFPPASNAVNRGCERDTETECTPSLDFYSLLKSSGCRDSMETY